MRQQIYQHVEQLLRPSSDILELNAGTGIDALYFTALGHRVHATDISPGMVEQIGLKTHAVNDKITFQQLSFTDLDRIQERSFDFIFSNFGGLNCTDDLKKVTVHFPALLKPGGHVTFVIMPRVCPWEIAGLIKNGRKALRRFHRGGTIAHLEGAYFKTYYHSLRSIRNSFDSRFRFIKSEGLAILSPSPHTNNFPQRYPRLDRMLTQLDHRLRNHFPFNRWGDHIIVTFQYTP